MPASSSAPRRSSRLRDRAKPAPPPPKKQRLGKSRTPKSVNEGYHASDSKSGSLSPDSSPASGSEYLTDTDSGPEPVKGYMSDEDDIFFGYWDRLDDDREVYIVSLKRKCRDASRCKNIMKEAGCEPYFIRLSKTYCCKFYARLTEDDAAKLKCVEGVHNVIAARLVAALDD